ncbi:hypothetical protein ACFSL6_14575 [Paenibacillus thailandensis]|uniref:WYL domain-containing protein n=1 Tax=Paenibacillus thailandensis TaxID=393250 RepID=A0ABW5QQZ3_9BACL
MSIHINDILPIKITEVKTEAELLLIFEVWKYIKHIVNSNVSFTNVTISTRLYATSHYKFIFENGLKFDKVPDSSISIKEIEDYFCPKNKFLFDIAFKTINDEIVTYDYNYDPDKNRILHSDDRSTAYVSLVARLLVEDFLNHRKKPRKLIIDHYGYQHTEDEYVELFILQNYGNRILEDIIEIRYPHNSKPQAEWVSYIYHQRRIGNFIEKSDVEAKHKYLVDNFIQGDVVLLYTFEKGRNKIKKLKTCYPAIIESFNETQISLIYYSPIETTDTHICRLLDNNLDPSEHTIKLEPRTANELQLEDVGIDHLYSNESNYILRPIDQEGNPIDNDGTIQYFKIGNHCQKIWLNTIETIYAVFKDHNIQAFNEVRFKNIYFKDRTPIYDQIRATNRR